MRHFNTAGPMRESRHYCVPPLSRVDLDDVLTLVRQEQYFVLHAPRQTGKASTLLALREVLNDGAAGAYRCVYANVEAGQAAREDTGRAMRAIPGHLSSQARSTLGDGFLGGVWVGLLDDFGPDGARGEALTRWSEAHPRPLVVLIDEIDALVGDTLLSVLRQLRAGYARRPASFLQSVALCGVRDVRDFRDLGLIAPDSPLRIANPIYAEVVPRELTAAAQEGLVQETAVPANKRGKAGRRMFRARTRARARRGGPSPVQAAGSARPC
ncbi:MAG: hypothetical protein J4F37_01465 [Acidobacteria bacterium]|nr:hypothetical protein [Acidobacteriota bacterium]